MTAELLDTLSNGLGTWFAQCYWCRCSSPTHTGRDELRLLAKAKAAGWLVRPNGHPQAATGRFTLVCPRCVRLRGIESRATESAHA